MARHIFVPKLVFNKDDSQYGGAGDFVTTCRSWVTDVRNRFRSGDGLGYASLNVPLNGSRWKVSDIVTNVVSGLESMYAFLVRDALMDTEWIFIFSGKQSATGNSSSSSKWAAMIGMPSGQSETNALNYGLSEHSWYGSTFRAYGNASHYHWAIAMNIHPSTSSWGRNWGFDDATEMTFSGGDYKDLNGIANPLTTWQSDWMPQGVVNPMGLYFSGLNTDQTSRPYQAIFVFCDATSSLAVYYSLSNESNIHTMIFSPNLINPVTPGDTHTAGAYWSYVNTASNQQAGNYETRVSVLNTDGTLHTTPQMVYEPRTFTTQNHKAGSLYKWRSVPISSPTLEKGWLNSDLVAEIGAFQDMSMSRQRFAHPSANEPMCRYGPSVATMWAPNVPAFPFWYAGLDEGT